MSLNLVLSDEVVFVNVMITPVNPQLPTEVFDTVGILYPARRLEDGIHESRHVSHH